MSSEEQKVLDSIKLTVDASLDGQLTALEAVRAGVLARADANAATLDGDASATDKMMARGALKELARLRGLVDSLIDEARLQRDS